LTTLIAISDVVSYRSLGHVTLDFIQLFFISPRSHTKSIAANSIWFPVVYRFENASNRQRETFSHRLESTKIIFCFRTELCPRLHWWRLRCWTWPLVGRGRVPPLSHPSRPQCFNSQRPRSCFSHQILVTSLITAQVTAVKLATV